MVELRQILGAFVLSFALAVAAYAQESTDQPDAETKTDEATESATDSEEPNAVEPDDESYLDIDEEDFTPSEEIPADQSITFPTDI